MNIKRLMEIGSYRGMRHRRGLPVRGPADAHQRAHAQGPAQGRDREEEDGVSDAWQRLKRRRRRRRRRKEPRQEEEDRSRSAARSASCTTGLAHIQASFNNTIDHDHRHRGQRDRVVERRRHRLQGLAQGHAVRGDAGGDDAGNAAKTFGMRSVDVRVKGPGSGRESAIRALQTVGIEVKSIRDVTPIPHNGCRPPKRRRV